MVSQEGSSNRHLGTVRPVRVDLGEEYQELGSKNRGKGQSQYFEFQLESLVNMRLCWYRAQKPSIPHGHEWMWLYSRKTVLESEI